MIAPNQNSLCQQAEFHYYDFIRDEKHESIPESIIDHIKQCQHCKTRVNKLKAVLSQFIESQNTLEQQANLVIITFLKLHFAYIDKSVTCKIVKPFLPSLLVPEIEIKIPTPITVHIDKCPQCQQDSESLGDFDLSIKQLRQLSQLLAEEQCQPLPEEDEISET